jgi:hypothetical protein
MAGRLNLLQMGGLGFSKTRRFCLTRTIVCRNGTLWKSHPLSHFLRLFFPLHSSIIRFFYLFHSFFLFASCSFLFDPSRSCAIL